MSDYPPYILEGGKRPQRQDSVLAQLLDLISLANQAGCYDASDFILKHVEDCQARWRQGKS